MEGLEEKLAKAEHAAILHKAQEKQKAKEEKMEEAKEKEIAHIELEHATLKVQLSDERERLSSGLVQVGFVLEPASRREGLGERL